MTSTFKLERADRAAAAPRCLRSLVPRAIGGRGTPADAPVLRVPADSTGRRKTDGVFRSGLENEAGRRPSCRSRTPFLCGTPGISPWMSGTPSGASPVTHTPATSGVRRQDLLGGLIHEYQRAA
jgi:hypothetical protein